MADETRQRGILYPARLPSLVRLDPDPAAAELVRWFWIPEWDLPPGRTSRQHLLAFPATNLVVEAGAAVLSGPTTRVSHRDLRGRGWGVGALLRPAATAAFVAEPARLTDRVEPVELPGLVEAVTAAWARPGLDPDGRRRAAADAFAAWLVGAVPAVDDDGRLANRLVELIEADPSILHPEQAAQALHVSVRTVQRLARRHVGLSPADLIRRRRLQAAAALVRERPGTDLATIAAELGYADHAHLTREFRDRLGFTPSGYRREAGTGRGPEGDP